MSLGLIGRKVGMMRIFTDEGDSIPVTVVDVSDNRVTQVKTTETDGYSAVQVAFGKRRPSRVNKAAAGHYAKAGVEAGTVLREFRVDASKAAEIKAGDVVPVTLFEVGQKIDVQGVSIGKGYAGTIKRYHFSRLKETHGSGPVARHAGSMGACSDPSRVMKGKKLPGHMGVERVTVQNLTVVKVDAENNLIALKGAIPGPKGGIVYLTDSVKKA